jgi:hypothetical protein
VRPRLDHDAAMVVARRRRTRRAELVTLAVYGFEQRHVAGTRGGGLSGAGYAGQKAPAREALADREAEGTSEAVAWRGVHEITKARLYSSLRLAARLLFAPCDDLRALLIRERILQLADDRERLEDLGLVARDLHRDRAAAAERRTVPGSVNAKLTSQLVYGVPSRLAIRLLARRVPSRVSG